MELARYGTFSHSACASGNSSIDGSRPDGICSSPLRSVQCSRCRVKRSVELLALEQDAPARAARNNREGAPPRFVLPPRHGDARQCAAKGSTRSSAATCSAAFFALVLKKALEDRIVALGLACLRAIRRAPNLPQAYNDPWINLVGAARRVR